MATKKTKTTRSVAKAGASEDGPLYRVLSDSFINNRLVLAGATIVYYGLPGSQLEPLNAEAKARKTQVRDIRVDNSLDAEDKQLAYQALSDEWNGVDDPDDYEAGEAGLDSPLSDAERIELEKHATAAVEAEAEKQKADTNYTGVKLQGHLEETESSRQGATPVTDKGGKKDK